MSAFCLVISNTQLACEHVCIDHGVQTRYTI